MTYADLLKQLQNLTPQQLAQNVTVYDDNNDEVFYLNDCDITGEEGDEIAGPGDYLDDGMFYLVKA